MLSCRHTNRDAPPRTSSPDRHGPSRSETQGIAGQTNNAILVEDPAVAAAFLDYWQRMHDDKLPKAKPKLSSPMSATRQGADFRLANEPPSIVPITGGAEIHTWFSPNRPERKKPTSKTKPAPTPPDLQEVYRRMRLAKEAVLFEAQQVLVAQFVGHAREGPRQVGRAGRLEAPAASLLS